MLKSLYTIISIRKGLIMPSTNDYLEYVLELLNEVKYVSYKKMMGEYLLYSDDLLFGGIYDNRFLTKKTDSNSDKGLEEEMPYPSAKPMYLIDSENPREIKELVLNACKDLSK